MGFTFVSIAMESIQRKRTAIIIVDLLWVFPKTFFGKVVEKLWMMRKSGDAFQWRLNELLTALWPGF